MFRLVPEQSLVSTFDALYNSLVRTSGNQGFITLLLTYQTSDFYHTLFRNHLIILSDVCRRKVYEILKANGVELPRYAILDRSSANSADYALEEHEDYIVVRGQQFNKPFVEKPISADDHNIYIYYPVSAGSGSQRLFRKVIAVFLCSFTHLLQHYLLRILRLCRLAREVQCIPTRTKYAQRAPIFTRSLCQLTELTSKSTPLVSIVEYFLSTTNKFPVE